MSALRIGDIAPNFIQNSTHGLIDFHRWLGQGWGLLFSYAGDFTPPCASEFCCMARLHAAFEQRGVRVLGISVDSVESHRTWIADIEEIRQVQVRFPILADIDRTVVQLYGLAPPPGSAARTVPSLLVVDPVRRVRAVVAYPDGAGRNFAEVLGVIDALHRADRSSAVPANGDDAPVRVPAQTDADKPAVVLSAGGCMTVPCVPMSAQPSRQASP
jgi:alkyl hydroperoxide reductase subunit AhpC